MSIQFHEVGATADLTVEVNRYGDGDLDDGVRAALARIDEVQAVDSVSVTGLRPRLNDLQADVEASLVVAVERPDTESVADLLAGGFGITVQSVDIENPPP